MQDEFGGETEDKLLWPLYKKLNGGTIPIELYGLQGQI